MLLTCKKYAEESLRLRILTGMHHRSCVGNTSVSDLFLFQTINDKGEDD